MRNQNRTDGPDKPGGHKQPIRCSIESPTRRWIIAAGLHSPHAKRHAFVSENPETKACGGHLLLFTRFGPPHLRGIRRICPMGISCSACYTIAQPRPVKLMSKATGKECWSAFPSRRFAPEQRRGLPLLACPGGQ